MWNPMRQWDDSTNVFHRDADGWRRVTNLMPVCYWTLVQVGPTTTAAKLIPPKAPESDSACARDATSPR